MEEPRLPFMRTFVPIILLIPFLWFCEPRDEIITSDSGAILSFSDDSVQFDTIFTEIRNITKRVRVYNRNNNALNVSQISLAGGESSPYTITVNGESGKQFKDVLIRGKDSIYILINISLPTPQPINSPFLVDDEINFFSNGNIQKIFLRSWGQDAIFYEDSLLACDLVWTNEKPIVLINSVGVAEGCKLTINEGTKIYLDNASSILVFGTLEVLGSSENPICFSGIRQEDDFDNIPGQWGNGFTNGIWFFDGSQNNKIEWSIIQNSTTAIRLGSVYDQVRPDLELNNTIIKNMAGDGIISFGANLIASNNLITNCGSSGISALLGGDLQLYHNTIANYSFAFSREDASVFLTDFFSDSTGSGIEINPLNADLQNNIFWGDQEDEWGFNFQGSGNNINVAYNFMKINNEDLNTFLSGNNNILGTKTNDLLFQDFREYDFQLDSLSPAQNRGNPNLPIMPGNDLNNNSRNDGLPDMGAYERFD